MFVKKGLPASRFKGVKMPKALPPFPLLPKKDKKLKVLGGKIDLITDYVLSLPDIYVHF